ncbi:MAG TPA: CotH kinase family protein, partial [Verrucomicrobiae bacterium]
MAAPPNAFNATGPGATWSYTLDTRTIFLQTNSAWLFIKGLAEASSPFDAWRQLNFDDSFWSNALAPFYYGDPYNSPGNPGTLLSDMQGNYSSIYLRKKFNVANASAVTNLILSAQIDDGFIIWVNGVEAARYNMPAGDIPYNGTAVTAFPEPGGNGGFPYTNFTLANPSTYLVDGTNVIAVHGFNQSLAGSSDFGFNAQLFTYLADASLAAPRVASVSPPAGSVFYLTNIAVTFSEPVTGVDAGDLLVNGMAATGVSGGSSNSTYTFSFLQPPYGNVAITWSASHGIVDFDTPPKPFDGTAPGSTFQYALLNPSTPTVVSKSPPAGATLSNLTQITVSFSESVSGVDAGDLLVNGMHATGLSGGGATYTFTFAQPPFGLVSVGWDAGHGIQDLEMPPNAFDPARPGSTWTYSLDDQAPPAIASQVPPAGASVTNLTQITVTFTEPVTGVNAGDLLINGVPATGLSGGGSTYTFSFSQPNATIIPITWATGHGIQDLAATPNPFNATAPGATWFYTTPDTLPPTLVSIDPSPFVTVRSLTQIRVTFSEAVSGVDTNDLLINSRPASVVAGSGAGPYTFSFFPPANGSVEVRWTTTNAITDLASPPNPFAGGEWTYTLDPNASFAGKVLLNEIMYDAPGGAKSNEWVELRNVATNLINLAGWRFTRGVDFTFPNVSIPAGGYLVVAANLAAFQAQHPGVTNVIGGWSGSLANSAETIELKTALGETVNAVRYASEGDWARRERGNGPSPVISITRNGATATVNVFGHGYTGNDQIVITGADQPEYNGRFTLGGIASSSFNITVSGAPASPATGNIVCHQILDDGASGWAWFSPVAGYGASLELVNLTLPNSSGQNWLPSAVSGGTPGRANSVATNNVAPLIEDVIHFPPIPRSTDPVAISAHVRDELSNGVAGVTLFYRNHTSAGPGAFSSTNMLDDGGHSDGVSGDGLYGAVLPAQANGTVIEFYVQAIDTSGRSRTWPAPAYDTNSATGTFGTPGQFANAIYQVSNETITNSMPIIRIILTGTENATFPAANRNSDASPNCTLISSDGDGVKVRYLCDARIRGAGSRSRTPPNNRLGIPGDNPWNGLSAINLNSQYPHAQLLGNNLALKAGLPAEPARIVQYRINGVNPSPITAPVNGSGNNGAGWGAFVLVEPPNGDLAADLFPQDGGGNYYRASTGNHNADLSYQSGNVQTYLSRGYYKTSNRTENDWTDFQNLTFAFSLTGANSDYVTAISTNVNVREWMTYFAVGSLMNYGETALFNGLGDDYALYRGDVDSRFQIIGHDFDTVFGQGDTLASPTGNGYVVQTNASIFIMLNPPYANANVANLRRFLTNNTFAPFFYAELKRLCDTTF